MHINIISSKGSNAVFIASAVRHMKKYSTRRKNKKINLMNLKCSCRWAPVVWWRARS